MLPSDRVPVVVDVPSAVGALLGGPDHGLTWLLRCGSRAATVEQLLENGLLAAMKEAPLCVR